MRPTKIAAAYTAQLARLPSSHEAAQYTTPLRPQVCRIQVHHGPEPRTLHAEATRTLLADHGYDDDHKGDTSPVVDVDVDVDDDDAHHRPRPQKKKKTRGSSDGGHSHGGGHTHGGVPYHVHVPAPPGPKGAPRCVRRSAAALPPWACCGAATNGGATALQVTPAHPALLEATVTTAAAARRARQVRAVHAPTLRRTRRCT